MTAQSRPDEPADLDFTAAVDSPAVSLHSDTDDPTEKLLSQADALIDAAQLQVALGNRDARLWRLLAAALRGADRAAEYEELAKKHQAAFGAPLVLNAPPGKTDAA